MAGFKKCISAVIHPVDVFSDMWERKSYPFGISFIILFALFLAKILERQTTGFAFNYNKLDDLNVAMIFVQVFGSFLMWSVMNWAISTLFDGKARIKEIWFFSSVALLPYLLSILLSVILSNIFVPDEGVFLSWIVYVGILWSVFMLFTALMIIHDYTFGRVLWSSILSIAGIAVILFLAVLCFSLFQQIYGFVQDIISELTFRVL